METTDFNGALMEWQNQQEAFVVARNAYRTAWADSYISSQAKTDTARKAEADKATSEARLARDNAELHAAAAWQLMLHMRGKVESSAMPGTNHGDAD